MNNIKNPVIGIPSPLVEGPYPSHPVLGVRRRYVEALRNAGAWVVIIPITDDINELRFHYDKCDGLLIAGGTDVNPMRYGGSLEYSSKGFIYDDIRDEAEITIAKWAFNERKPLTGICRGIQVMNVALGGTRPSTFSIL